MVRSTACEKASSPGLRSAVICRCLHSWCGQLLLDAVHSNKSASNLPPANPATRQWGKPKRDNVTRIRQVRMDTAGLYHRVMRDVLARSKVHHFATSSCTIFSRSHTERVCRRTFVRKHSGQASSGVFQFLAHHLIKNNKHRRILALGGEITQWPEI